MEPVRTCTFISRSSLIINAEPLPRGRRLERSGDSRLRAHELHAVFGNQCASCNVRTIDAAIRASFRLRGAAAVHTAMATACNFEHVTAKNDLASRTRMRSPVGQATRIRGDVRGRRWIGNWRGLVPPSGHDGHAVGRTAKGEREHVARFPGQRRTTRSERSNRHCEKAERRWREPEKRGSVRGLVHGDDTDGWGVAASGSGAHGCMQNTSLLYELFPLSLVG
jgi:hypothetical protein